VANLVQADLLVMLSDVDGLHGRDGAVVPEVTEMTPEIEELAGGSSSGLGSGGMRSKLDAVRIATASGLPAVIAAFRRGALARVLAGEAVGTLFHPGPSRLTSRKAWIGYATSPKGRVVVDAGARAAIRERNRSLLAAGVKRVEGSFAPGDAVDIVDEDGRPFARGLVGFSSDELARVAGLDSARVAEIVGDAREVVHRDELVVR
jgi:glutamate 5-kinase